MQSNAIAKNSQMKFASPELFDDKLNLEMKIAAPRNANHTEQRQITDTSPQTINNLFGFDDDIANIPDATSIAASNSFSIQIDKAALEKQRESLKRFLNNPKPKATHSPKKWKKPMKVADQNPLGVFGASSHAQKDIRAAFHSGNNREPTEERGNNLFSDTETEIVCFVWISINV